MRQKIYIFLPQEIIVLFRRGARICSKIAVSIFLPLSNGEGHIRLCVIHSSRCWPNWVQSKRVAHCRERKKKNTLLGQPSRSLAWRRLDNWEEEGRRCARRVLSWICADVQSRFHRLRGLVYTVCICHMTIPSVAQRARCADGRIPARYRWLRRGCGSILQASEAQPYETESKGAPGRRRALKMQLAK